MSAKTSDAPYCQQTEGLPATVEERKRIRCAMRTRMTRGEIADALMQVPCGHRPERRNGRF